MKEWLEQYLIYLNDVKKASKNTLSAYATDLKQFMSYLVKEEITDFNKISDTRIKAYQLYQKKNGKSNATISRSLVSIKNFIAFLIRKRVMEEDPTDCIHPPKVEKSQPKVITYEQMKALLQAPDVQVPLGRRDRAILELLYATGMKTSELIQLKQSDVNLGFGCIRIAQEGHERVLPLGAVVKEALTDYLTKLAKETEAKQDNLQQIYLFCTRLGNPFTRQGIWKLVKEYAVVAKLGEDFSLQTIRNSFAAHMIENGADMKSIQELLGVTDVIAAQRFLKSGSSETFSTYQRTHPRNKL
jgi:integrase/recombinase XerD